MTNAQHRWKEWLDERSITIIEGFAEDVKPAWKADSKYPRSYPRATEYVFSETILDLRGRNVALKKRRRLPHGTPPPVKCFADLFYEPHIRWIYEDRHADSYDVALKTADLRRGGASSKALYKLMKAAETAFHVSMGGEVPAPRNSFLHREFLELAKVLDLHKHRNAALAEFLEDLCPCGKAHKPEAIRKLRKRKALRD